MNLVDLYYKMNFKLKMEAGWFISRQRTTKDEMLQYGSSLWCLVMVSQIQKFL